MEFTEDKEKYTRAVAKLLKDHPFFKWDRKSRAILNSCFKHKISIQNCYNLIIIQ